ncbi:putative inactive leucine-rich repeat receptor-like protein kinase IMK2 [Leucoagaricus sp. SymC.cos]|nr:putative inactive leucine-rich repeat receptor-like protein kinase IMK2 [Leucoagaricus sp. SymC.cos]
MDYYGRGSLDKFIKEHDPPFHQRLRWVLDITKGLHKLHSAEVYHGSLRCGNVFVDDEDRAVIADYGVAQLTDNPEFTFPKSADWHRWGGPELVSFTSDSSIRQDKLDIYALGMTMLEVRFFHEVPDSSQSYNIPGLLGEKAFR